MSSEENTEKKKRRKRMTLPKKKDDIEKVVEEIEEREGHEHHHHHHHGDLDEIIAIVELLIDSLNVKMKELEDKVRLQGNEIIKIYMVLSAILEYLATDDTSKKHQALNRALSVLES